MWLEGAVELLIGLLDNVQAAEQAANALCNMLRSGAVELDFAVLEILVKMKTKKLGKALNYNEFTQWLGHSIYPKEEHFFRHDSKKNPQFDLNLSKTVEKTEKNQILVNNQIVNQSRGSLKEKFI